MFNCRGHGTMWRFAWITESCLEWYGIFKLFLKHLHIQAYMPEQRRDGRWVYGFERGLPLFVEVKRDPLIKNINIVKKILKILQYCILLQYCTLLSYTDLE